MRVFVHAHWHWHTPVNVLWSRRYICTVWRGRRNHGRMIDRVQGHLELEADMRRHTLFNPLAQQQQLRILISVNRKRNRKCPEQ